MTTGLLLVAAGVTAQAATARTDEAEALRSWEETRQTMDPQKQLWEMRAAMTESAEPEPVDLRPALVFVIMGVVAVAGAWWVFRRQVDDLGLPKDERDLAKVAPSRGVGVSPREAVFAAVARAKKGVTPGRVAFSAGVSKEEAELMLEDLAGEGRIDAGRDDEGRIVYKAAS